MGPEGGQNGGLRAKMGLKVKNGGLRVKNGGRRAQNGGLRAKKRQNLAKNGQKWPKIAPKVKKPHESPQICV